MVDSNRKRPLNRYVSAARSPGRHLYGALRAFQEFESPAKVLWAYFLQRPFAEHSVQIRPNSGKKRGLRIYLSGHPTDIATVYVIFARREYGRIEPGARVVDVGANIGTFTLYALREGAGEVYAYEPSSEAHALLMRNTKANGYEDQVRARRLAVSDRRGNVLNIPAGASPFNAAKKKAKRSSVGSSGVKSETVKTTSLDAIIEETGPIDLLKLDCEGAEYDIIPAASADSLQQIKALRLEYHAGNLDQLSKPLLDAELKMTYHQAEGDRNGMAFFKRSRA